MKQLRLTLTGKVQGVSFRSFVYHHAHALKLTGWAKNNEDGTVTVIAQGKQEALEKLIHQCRTGHPFAKIERVEVEWKDKEEHFSGFTIIR